MLFVFSCKNGIDIDTSKLTATDPIADITYLNDKRASELIISDNIDILIFIGGLTGTNRYLLSTYKSAKKQISFHPASSSGIKELDYWITDSVLNPINIKEKISEKVIRMEHLFNFTKPENNYLPKINEPPMKKNNFISFSSFSNPMKLSLKSLELWLEVLKNFQGSKLYLKFFNFLDNRKIQNTIYNFLEKNSIQKERIIFSKSLLFIPPCADAILVPGNISFIFFL